MYDLALVKVLSNTSTTYTAGDNISFSISVENQGNVPASGIEVIDYLPVNTSFVSASVPHVLSNGNAILDFGSIVA